VLRQVWAAFGAIAPRGLLAASTIVAAAVTDPFEIGLYSWAIIALSLYSALTDLPIRHVAQIAIRTSSGRKFLERYAWWSSVVGLILIASWNLIIAHLLGQESSGAGFLSLLPLVVIPVARAVAIQPTAAFELEGLWARVSLYRAIGAIVGAAVGLPIVLLAKSIAGACIAVMIAEFFYVALLYLMPVVNREKSWRKRITLEQGIQQNYRKESSESTYRYMAMYTGLGWLQSQSERVLLGMWAGTTALGVYSIGAAIGRSGGDAIASSQQAVLRVDLSRGKNQNDAAIKRVLSRSLRPGIVLAIANAFAVTFLSVFMLPRFLGAAWTGSLHMGPVLALSCIPLVVAASGATVHVQRERGRIAYIGPATAVLFAPLVAVAALHSLTTAAWIVLLRECVLALVHALLMGRAAPWREVAFALGSVALGSFILLAI